MRRLLAAASISAILLIQAIPSAAAPSVRVVVVTLDGTRLADWRSPALPNLAALIRRGAVGLLSTRTAVLSENPSMMRDHAYATLGTGMITRNPARSFLSLSLPSGLVLAAPASGDGRPPWRGLSVPSILPQQVDESFPGGTRLNARAAQAVVDAALRDEEMRALLIDLGDTAQVERELGTDPDARAPWMRLAMARADAFIGWLRGLLTADDTLIVASMTPPLERQRERRFLSAIAMTGPGVRPGMLTSSSTERDGVVTIPDITATILDRAGADIPDTMTGSVMRVVAGTPEDLASLERDLVHASMVRGPLMRGSVIAGGALTVLALLTVLAGRGRGGRTRGFPTTWRGILDTGLIAVASAPLALLVEPLFGASGLTSTAITVASVCVGLALVLRALTGSRTAIAGVLGVTAVAVLADLLLGSGLAERSPLSYLIAEGARFHGIGNEAMGVVIGAALLGAAAFLDRQLTSRRILLTGGVLAIFAGVMAAPQVGAKFGSVPAAVPAFALLVVLAAGRRFDLRAAIGIAIVTILAGGVIVALDSLRETGTHVARAVGEGGSEILGRKAGAAGRLLALSYWMGALVACAGSLALIAWRRPSLLGRGLWGRPGLRRALLCAAVAAAGCIGANDAGVTAAAWIALLAAASVFSPLLVPSDA